MNYFIVMLDHIPTKVLRAFNLPEDRSIYTKVTNGYNSATWIGNDKVIQAVYSQSLEHHDAVLQITEELRSNGHFPGLDFKDRPVVGSKFWWRVSSRIEGRVANSIPGDRFENFEIILNPLLDDLLLLASIEIDYIPEPSVSQHLSPLEIRSNFLEENPNLTELINNTPNEATSKLVLAHGDPLLKNIILTDNQEVVLIDWESCQMLPQLYDLGHCLANLLIGSNFPEAREVDIQKSIQLLDKGSTYLDYKLKESELIGTLAYALLRETFTAKATRDKLNRSLKIIQEIVLF